MANNELFMTISKENKSNVEEDFDYENSPWDDTLLIKAYDRAVNLAKANIEKKNKERQESFKAQTKMVSSNNIDSLKEPKSVGCWRVGAKCRTSWSYDGIEYEAEIISMKLNKNQVRIKFVGYNNEENTKISSLQPSLGEEARQKQILDSQTVAEENGCSSTAPPLDHHSTKIVEGMMFPPPPPPHVISYLPKDEQEALSAMLMSWYMSGYHTGYYQGLIAGNKYLPNKKK